MQEDVVPPSQDQVTCADCANFHCNLSVKCFITIVRVQADSKPCNFFKEKCDAQNKS